MRCGTTTSGDSETAEWSWRGSSWMDIASTGLWDTMVRTASQRCLLWLNKYFRHKWNYRAMVEVDSCAAGWPQTNEGKSHCLYDIAGRFWCSHERIIPNRLNNNTTDKAEGWFCFMLYNSRRFISRFYLNHETNRMGSERLRYSKKVKESNWRWLTSYCFPGCSLCIRKNRRLPGTKFKIRGSVLRWQLNESSQRFGNATTHLAGNQNESTAF